MLDVFLLTEAAKQVFTVLGKLYREEMAEAAAKKKLVEEEQASISEAVSES